MRTRAALVVVLVGLASARAEAFVQTTTDMGNGFFWRESCVPVTIYLNNFPKTSGMSVDSIVKSVVAAAHTWSGDAVTCADGTSPYLEIVPTLAPASTTPPAVTNPAIAGSWDTKNSIVFRTEMWTRNGKPAATMADQYDFNALAITTVTARSDGHIVDVDMEINGLTKSWLNFDPGVSAPFVQGDTNEWFDLQNALTHEFGHFIGLNHTCFIASADNPMLGTDGKLRPLDNKGNKVPDCDASPVIVEQTVMFNVTGPGETSQRFLSPDDIDAVCTIYASSRPHGECALDTANPGCALAPARPARSRRAWGFGLSAAALGAASILASRRRRA